MGYYVSSVFSISPNDKHSYFIYVVPGHNFETDWIDTWMQQQFVRVANRIGPGGVIVAPTPKHNERYLESVLDVTGGGCFFSCAYPQLVHGTSDGSDMYEHWPEGQDFRMLHSGRPFLIFSDTPIQAKDESNTAIIIDLGAYPNEKALGQVIDVLLSIMQTGDFTLLENLPNPHPDFEPRANEKEMQYLDALELKPNVFGVGINFNYLLRKIATSFAERRS